MKKSPYNAYIHFEILHELFQQSYDRPQRFLKCGWMGIELSCQLLNNALTSSQECSTEKIEAILQDVLQQLQLLATFLPPWQGAIPKESKQHCSKNLQQLLLLPDTFQQEVNQLTQHYFAVIQKLGVGLGLEEQMNALRLHFGWPAMAVKTTKTLDYEQLLISPLQLSQLQKEKYYNSEDELFMVVHQVSECWFNIGLEELNHLQQLIQEGSTKAAVYQPFFVTLSKILLYLGEHILLLEQMVLANYHPLRVALRGASGGQSQQAHQLVYQSKELFEYFLKLLEEQGITLEEVLEKPAVFKDFLLLIKQFEKLERALKNFFFQHYVLSASIIGARSFGSIGHEIVSLADKFVEPLFPALDQAKYALTLKTNFQYGQHSGFLILEKEAPTITATPSITYNKELMQQTINNYFEAISALDAQQWIALFAEEGVIEDPVGSRPYRGEQELGVFFKGILRTFIQLQMSIEEQHFYPHEAAVQWKATALAFNGKALTFEGKEVFQIDEQGKIQLAQVYWNPAVVAEQL